MNENSNSSTSSSHHGLTAEAISRRAYELWEQEGRPESRDLHHWLRAEQELLAEQAKSSNQQPSKTAAAPASGSASSAPSRTGNTDTQLQGKGAGTTAAKAAPKGGNPFPAETAGGRFVKSGRSGGK